jgi:hypothetical protein
VKTRACGHMHPDGLPCLKPVLYEEGCCTEKTYDHDGPHEHVDKDGRITHRWEETLQVVDLPYDAYKPWTEEDIKSAETNGSVMA